MKKEKIGTFLVPAAFFLLAAYILFSARFMSERDAMFPNLIAWIMLLISVIEGISEWRKKQVGFRFAGNNLAKVAEVIAALFGYIFLLGKIGFYFDSLILSMAIMWLLGYRRKIVLIMASLLITTVVFVIFYVLIKVPLPTLFF